ncbi:uncharacterized protein LOC131614245 [Vicia villosa]|uniref:uncharacterized protein LOC131614245 n=1 Tax=Vicia villosa TaxID=3911 RepID=UPI00273BC131|nr:uncharacterized protein LOC131614245 [Vicia villosa]
MAELGIPEKFINWIMLGTATVTYRFNVNGDYTEILEAKRDDVLLFSRGDQSIDIMLDAFQNFSKSTGLIMNPKKCKEFFGGMDDNTKSAVLLNTGFTEGQFPIRYLGIPLASKRLNIHHYLPLIDKIVCRIRHWTAHLLSTAGRIQLVKSIVVAITQYWMHCLPLPKAVLKRVDSICRNFIWTGVTVTMDWYHVMCHNIARPRAKVILWLAFQNRLATKQRLFRLGFLQHQLCELCEKEDESLDHSLFACPQTVGIWNAILHWMGISDFNNLNFDWIKRKVRGKGARMSLLKAVIAEVIYGIWVLRN